MLQIIAFSAAAVLLATVKSQQYSSNNFCPQGGTPQYVSGLPATTLQVAQSCLSGLCSTGYTCQPSTSGGLPYCCSNSMSVSNGVFNNGYTNGYTTNNNAYPSSSIYQNSGAYTTTNNNQNSYTNRYNDNSNTANNAANSAVYASSLIASAQAQGSSNSYCPQGGQPQYVSGLPATFLQVPRSCSSTLGSCSAGYTCQTSTSGFSYCCSSSGSITTNGAYNTNNVYNNGNTFGYSTSNTNANSYTNSFATSSNTYYPSSSTNPNQMNGVSSNYQNTYNNLNNFNNRYNDNSGLYYVATTAFPTNYGTNSAYNAAYSQGNSNNGPAGQFCPAGTTPYYYPNQHVPSCLVGISNCPYPSTCQSTPTNSVGAIGHCCNGNVG